MVSPVKPASVVVHHNDWDGYREDVIVLDGGVAVCMLAFPGGDDPVGHQNRAWLHDLSVIPDFRRKGYATVLVGMCREAARKDGRKRLSIWVSPGSWMEDWYRRNGFVRDPLLVRRDGNIIYNLEL